VIADETITRMVTSVNQRKDFFRYKWFKGKIKIPTESEGKLTYTVTPFCEEEDVDHEEDREVIDEVNVPQENIFRLNSRDVDHQSTTSISDIENMGELQKTKEVDIENNIYDQVNSPFPHIEISESQESETPINSNTFGGNRVSTLQNSLKNPDLYNFPFKHEGFLLRVRSDGKSEVMCYVAIDGESLVYTEDTNTEDTNHLFPDTNRCLKGLRNIEARVAELTEESYNERSKIRDQSRLTKRDEIDLHEVLEHKISDLEIAKFQLVEFKKKYEKEMEELKGNIKNPARIRTIMLSKNVNCNIDKIITGAFTLTNKAGRLLVHFRGLRQDYSSDFIEKIGSIIKKKASAFKYREGEIVHFKKAKVLRDSRWRRFLFFISGFGAVFITFMFTFAGLFYRIIFTALIIWRGIKVNIDFFDKLAEVMRVLSFTFKIPLVTYFLYPFIALVRLLSNINLNLDAVNVTCSGSQAPLELFFLVTILIFVVIVIESNFSVFQKVYFRAMNLRFSLAALQFKLKYDSFSVSSYAIKKSVDEHEHEVPVDEADGGPKLVWDIWDSRICLRICCRIYWKLKIICSTQWRKCSRLWWKLWSPPSLVTDKDVEELIAKECKYCKFCLVFYDCDVCKEKVCDCREKFCTVCKKSKSVCGNCEKTQGLDFLPECKLCPKFIGSYSICLDPNANLEEVKKRSNFNPELSQLNPKMYHRGVGGKTSTARLVRYSIGSSV
jgi:hypothetical protein